MLTGDSNLDWGDDIKNRRSFIGSLENNVIVIAEFAFLIEIGIHILEGVIFTDDELKHPGSPAILI